MKRRFLLLFGAAALHAMGAAGEAPPAKSSPGRETLASRLLLVRYDLPRGLSDGFAPTRQTAHKVAGQDGVDWPDFKLNGQPLWQESGEAQPALTVHKGNAAHSLFRSDGDDEIQPGGHWLRALEFQRDRRHIYTADRTARCGSRVEPVNGLYELWAFPTVIRGEGGPVVRNVEVKYGGQVIYHKEGPWRTLTLLLVANERGKPYELTVDGRGPLKLDAGLAPIKLGDPQENVLGGETRLPGDGPVITVQSNGRAGEFPNPKEWAADLAALSRPLPAAPAWPARGAGPQRYLGIEVPESPLTLYAAALPEGMSGGFFHKGMNPAEYAHAVRELGFDTVFDPAATLPAPEDPESFERRAAALGAERVRLGLQYDQNWSRPDLQHPNLPMLAHTLPEWHRPLYRSLSLAAQRMTRLPNFAGLQIGADNAGYISAWPSAPPIPDRPWSEAMIEFTGAQSPKVPRPASLGAPELPFEEPAPTTMDFVKYIQRYESSFRQYGYFAEAVREVNPGLAFTTGSFGSSPGPGGRGGWPWASLPGRAMFEGLAWQQAYDWNSTHAAKPLHNLALTDRLRSYYPRTRTWSLLDNFRFLYGREAWQRACALALTRGIQGLGTNFLASPGGEGDREGAVRAQQEMNAWARRFGGVFARTEPQASIGVFYGHYEALQRRVLTGENPSPEQLAKGSQEGKVTEALFLCHAAGWPARVITFQELRRGPLPTSMKAILLVGLDEADASWKWFAGVEDALQLFRDRGGRIIADEESVCPGAVTKPGLNVAAYVAQSNIDPTPLLFARNQENITKLRAGMEGIEPPLAASDNPLLWAIPAQCADTLYVTAINQAFAEGAEAGELVRPVDVKSAKPEAWKTKGNASLYVKPQKGRLAWHTERPIYDVRQQRKLSPEEAADIDLTQDAFAWYALPPAEVQQPEVSVSVGGAGFYEARPTMKNRSPIGGLPVELTVSGPAGSASVYGATGQVVRLPLNEYADHGDYVVRVTELLTGLHSDLPVHPGSGPAKPAAAPRSVIIRDPGALGKFGSRRRVPLIVALTADQQKDPQIVAQARTLADFYRKKGRSAGRVAVAGPEGIVESLQVYRCPSRYPQWQTTPADLVLFGTQSNNVLLLDQARGQLFPVHLPKPGPGAAEVLYTRSPFVGECDVVNIFASDTAGITAAVQALTAPPNPAQK